MKLTNSIPALKDSMYWLRDVHDKHTLAQLIVYLWDDCNNRCVVPITGFRWALWFTLPKYKRDAIIMKSVGDKEYVGGYFMNVNDSHIESLLRKVFTHVYVSRLVAEAKVLTSNQGR